MANGLTGGKWRASEWRLAAVVPAICLACACGRGEPAPTRKPIAEVVSTVRSEPRTFNRLISRDRTSNLIALLTQARLVRLNLQTQEIEPGLAEKWTPAPDGRTWTLSLRRGVTFSDGAPFTAADVLFTLSAVYDPSVQSPLADDLRLDGRPIAARALDDYTVVLELPTSYGPGLRMLDPLVILPRHRLEPALHAKTLRDAWNLTTPLDEIVGLGPFVLDEYRPGERIVLRRNSRYWRRDGTGAPLPRLDRIVLEIVPDQNAEMLRLQSGEADLITAEVRPDDVATLRRLAKEGRLQLQELGVSLDPDALWFNLSPAAQRQPGRAWLQRHELRQAIALAVDREAFADAVHLGAAVPIAGPVTPGNRTWFDATLPVPPHDPQRARALLGSIGLADRDGDGMLETADGNPARFALLTQKGHSVRERAVQVLQSELKKIGLGVDLVTLEYPAVIDRVTKGAYDAAYFGTASSDTDPAAWLGFWLSSGAYHLWNPEQPRPATAWERRIDELMRAQVATQDLQERRRLFNEVQRILAEEQPVIFFVAPRVMVATSPRVADATPALLQPSILWNAEVLRAR